MAVIYKTWIILFFPLLFSCNAFSEKPLIAKDNTNKNERENTLFAFIGEKIELDTLPYELGDFDNGFKAKYKVIQKVYGNYSKDEIDFVAYDHYGTPEFSNFKHVLLFVSKDKDIYYHEKYLYYDIYKTTDGRWAGTCADINGRLHNRDSTVKPVKINFAQEVSYKTKLVYNDGTEEKLTFPEPYFKTVGNKAIAIYGYYIKDLFQIQKNGVLTARGLFGDKDPNILETKEVDLINVDTSAIENQ